MLDDTPCDALEEAASDVDDDEDTQTVARQVSPVPQSSSRAQPPQRCEVWSHWTPPAQSASDAQLHDEDEGAPANGHPANTSAAQATHTYDACIRGLCAAPSEGSISDDNTLSAHLHPDARR